MTPEALSAVCQAVDIPVVAIGGINKDRLEPLKGTGVDGVTVVSAIFAAEDIEKATRELKEAEEKSYKTLKSCNYSVPSYYAKIHSRSALLMIFLPSNLTVVRRPTEQLQRVSVFILCTVSAASAQTY